MSKRYVRLTPYDRRTGALCRRYMIGGCLFKEDQWYELDSAWAARLAPLTQGSTHTPVFQVLTPERYGETVRAELAAAYMRGGVSLAMAGALAPPVPGAPPKNGARKSAFDGMATEEATLAGAAAAAGTITTNTLPSVDAPADPPQDPTSDEGDAEGNEGDEGDEGDEGEEGEVIDLALVRTHKAANALAERYGVSLDGLATVAAKRDRLAEELFTEADEAD